MQHWLSDQEPELIVDDEGCRTIFARFTLDPMLLLQQEHELGSMFLSCPSRFDAVLDASWKAMGNKVMTTQNLIYWSLKP